MALIGYPGGGPLTAAPGRVGHSQFIVTQDAYGQGVAQRTVVPIRGSVLHGDSGGPVVDRSGHVRGDDVRGHGGRRRRIRRLDGRHPPRAGVARAAGRHRAVRELTAGAGREI